MYCRKFLFHGTPSSLMIGAGLGFFLTAVLAKFEKEDKVDEHPDKLKDKMKKVATTSCGSYFL